jgi:hypothetical protein
MEAERVKVKKKIVKKKAVRKKKVRIKKKSKPISVDLLAEGWEVLEGNIGGAKILNQHPKDMEACSRFVRKKGGTKVDASTPVLVPLNGTLSTCEFYGLRRAVRNGNRIVATVSLAAPRSSKLVWNDYISKGLFEVRESTVPD